MDALCSRETRRGLCRRCCGRNLASGKLVEVGEHEATSPGKVRLVNVTTVTNKNGDLVVITRNGKPLILDDTPVKKSKKSNTVREGKTIRIISARLARPQERFRYEK